MDIFKNTIVVKDASAPSTPAIENKLNNPLPSLQDIQRRQSVMTMDHIHYRDQAMEFLEIPSNTNNHASTPQHSGLMQEKQLDLQDKRLLWEPKKDLLTRNLSCGMLAIAWGIGTCAVVIAARIFILGRIAVPTAFLGMGVAMGSNVYYFLPPSPGKPSRLWLEDHRVYIMPEAAVTIVALLSTFALTIVLDGINYIPSTTLRWALRFEGRLDFNSNPRLFTSAKHFAPNCWYVNIISAMALVLAYGGTSVLTSETSIKTKFDKNGSTSSTDVSGPRYGLDFNAWGCLGLGIGLSIQAAISTWCLILSDRVVLTWDSNPLGTARAFAAQGNERVASPVLEKSGDTSSSMFFPVATMKRKESELELYQPSMAAYVPQVRLIVNLYWAMVLLVSICTIVVGGVGKHVGDSPTDFPVSDDAETDSLAYWRSYRELNIPYTDSFYINRKDWLGLIIQCLVLAIVTLSLHLVETVTQVARDERVWRRAATIGVIPNRSVLLEGFASWPCFLLGAFKSLIHWIFSNAVAADLYLNLKLLPLVTLTASLMVTGICVEIFCLRWRPKGPQPTTYGNIERLLTLVDEWNQDRVFWVEQSVIPPLPFSRV